MKVQVASQLATAGGLSKKQKKKTTSAVAASARQAGGVEADLASVIESRWAKEWTLLERSVGSKKEGARQKELAAQRAAAQAELQSTWNAAEQAAKSVKLAAAEEAARLKRLDEEEAQVAKALAAAKLRREVAAEQARQAREAEKAAQEAAWRATTGGFTALMDEYGIGGGGGVIRDGSVVNLRQGLQDRHEQENRTAARVHN